MCMYIGLSAQPFHLISIQLKRFELEPHISRFGVPFTASVDKFDSGIAYLVHKWCVMTKKKKKITENHDQSLSIRPQSQYSHMADYGSTLHTRSIDRVKKLHRINYVHWYKKTEDLKRKKKRWSRLCNWKPIFSLD